MFLHSRQSIAASNKVFGKNFILNFFQTIFYRKKWMKTFDWQFQGFLHILFEERIFWKNSGYHQRLYKSDYCQEKFCVENQYFISFFKDKHFWDPLQTYWLLLLAMLTLKLRPKRSSPSLQDLTLEHWKGAPQLWTRYFMA